MSAGSVRHFTFQIKIFNIRLPKCLFMPLCVHLCVLVLVLLWSILFIYFLISLAYWWHTCPLCILTASLVERLFALTPFLSKHPTVLISVLLLFWYFSNLPKIFNFPAFVPVSSAWSYPLFAVLSSSFQNFLLTLSSTIFFSSLIFSPCCLTNIVRLRACDGTRHASSRLTQRSLLPTTICWSSGPHRPAQRAGRGAWKRQSLPESAQNWITGYRYTHTFVLISCTTSSLWLTEAFFINLQWHISTFAIK